MSNQKLFDTRVGFGVYDEKGREYGCAIRIEVGRIDYSGTMRAWSNPNPNDPRLEKCPYTEDFFYKEWKGKPVNMPVKRAFSVYVWATRKGKLFGGSTSAVINFDTLEEAEAFGKAKAEQMRKRYVAKASKAKLAQGA